MASELDGFLRAEEELAVDDVYGRVVGYREVFNVFLWPILLGVEVTAGFAFSRVSTYVFNSPIV